MARLTDGDKKLILADYHTNKYSQRELAKKHDVSVGTISKLTKEVKPENEHLVNAQASVIRANEELTSEQMNAIMNTSMDIVRREGLIFGNAEKLAKKLNTMADQVDEPQDLKHLVDANDKLSITLRVNERHAPKSDTNVAVQTNNNLTKAEISQAVADSLPD